MPCSPQEVLMRRSRELRQKTIPSRQRSRQTDKDRGTSSSRGYGSVWQRYRIRFLSEYPFCIACITVKADVIDHIIPVIQDGDLAGSNDPLFMEPWNHQPLCRRHHAAKTATHDERLSGSRVWLLSRLDLDADTDVVRNELLTLSEIWDRWVHLGTGEMLVLES